MAVAPTGAIFKSLLFDGQSSRNYGVYITGRAVYNAPQRAVEMISIPNRNGAFALDKGYFENIEVTYPAGIFADNEADFAEAISDFRNFLCSRKGYVRLSDEYNPNEYRMAIYKSGLEVTPAQLKAGEFNIVFDCKPQRWLTSGETAITVSSGDTVTNPTLFESGPLLEVEGYGNIEMNNSTITLEDIELGIVTLSNVTADNQGAWSFDANLVNVGDTITLPSFKFTDTLTGDAGVVFNSASVASVPTASFPNASATITLTGQNVAVATFDVGAFSWQYSTTAQTVSGRFRFELPCTKNGTSLTAMWEANVVIDIDGNTGSVTSPTVSFTLLRKTGRSYSSEPLYAESTVSALGHPTYIDLELGEAWKVSNTDVVSLNNAVYLPAKLPTLQSGANEITYDSTVTSLKAIPRWWKV